MANVNYHFYGVVHEHFTELYSVAGGANLMTHCAQERDHIAVDSLAEVMQRLCSIFVEYEEMLPFFTAKEMEGSSPLAGRLEGLARNWLSPCRATS